MLQFIHAADIHIDSPLKGLTLFETAPVERIRSATRDAFCNLVQLALDERVAFVLIAGDLWDCDWPDAGPGIFFGSQAARLDKAGIPIFIVKGNHDAQSQLTSNIKNWPKNVTMFKHKKAHTELLEKWNVAIHGQSYAQQHVVEDLSAAYPPLVPGAFNIGMLHTCLDDGGTDYAPACLEKLIKRGYDYWALGHIHDRQDLSCDGVHIEFPGNLQGRSVRETGPKGCTLVTVADDHSVSTRFEALDVVRWEEISISADEADVDSAVHEVLAGAVAKADGRLLAVRIHVTGAVTTGQPLRDRVDAIAAELGDVWIEKILVKPAVHEKSDSGGAPLDVELRELIAEMQTNEDVTAEWMQDFLKLSGQLGECKDLEAAGALDNREQFRIWWRKLGRHSNGIYSSEIAGLWPLYEQDDSVSKRLGGSESALDSGAQRGWQEYCATWTAFSAFWHGRTRCSSPSGRHAARQPEASNG
jgi:DNA repair exonuclease SbcCD nuclease subunit